MSALLQGAAQLTTVLGLACAALVLIRRHDVRNALAVLLEFLLAAGLLRLADHPTYRSLATAAAIVVVRKLVTIGLRRGTPAAQPS